MYISLDRDTEDYEFSYLVDGIATLGSGGTPPQIGDILEISRRGGFFVGGYYRSGTFTQLFNIPDDNTSLYYPYMIFRSGTNNFIIDNFITQLNPIHFSTYSPPLKKDRIQTNLGVVPIPSPQAIVTNILKYSEVSIIDFLGYSVLHLTNISNSPSFIADNRFNLSIFNDTYIVVLDNMELQSYDGFDGIRKSILSVIPYSDDNTNRVIQYEPATFKKY